MTSSLTRVVGGAIATVLLLGLAFWGTTVRADPPSELAPFLNACKTFTKLNAELSFSTGDAGRARPMLFTARPGWFLIDLLWGTQNHYAFQQGQLTVDTRSMPEPAVPAQFPTPVVADLFAACRTGFPGTQWTQRSPDLDGYRYKFANVTWYKADLPYPWADGFELFLGLNTKSKKLAEVAWKYGEDGEWDRVRVAMLDFAAQANPDFNRHAPPFDIPRPARFQDIK